MSLSLVIVMDTGLVGMKGVYAIKVILEKIALLLYSAHICVCLEVLVRIMENVSVFLGILGNLVKCIFLVLKIVPILIR